VILFCHGALTEVLYVVTDLGKARDIWEGSRRGREIVIGIRRSTWKERQCESSSTARCSLIGLRLPAFSATVQVCALSCAHGAR